MTITEFLLARIAEDEAVARAATPGRWFRDSGWSISAPAPEGWDGPYVVVETPRARNDSEFVARYDPARVLAECAAKRAIVESRTALHSQDLKGDPIRSGMYFALSDVVEDLAAVYADHPGYLQEWAL